MWLGATILDSVPTVRGSDSVRGDTYTRRHIVSFTKLKLSLWPGQFGPLMTVDQQTKKGGTILIDIVDFHPLEETGLLLQEANSGKMLLR